MGHTLYPHTQKQGFSQGSLKVWFSLEMHQEELCVQDGDTTR